MLCCSYSRRPKGDHRMKGDVLKLTPCDPDSFSICNPQNIKVNNAVWLPV